MTAIVQRGLVARVEEQGAKLADRLEARFRQHPHVGDLRGRGLFRGVELVENRETKAPFDPTEAIAGRLKKAAFEEGLICYPMSGTIDGRRGDHVLLAPPFIISDDELDEVIDKLDRAITSVVGP